MKNLLVKAPFPPFDGCKSTWLPFTLRVELHFYC